MKPCACWLLAAFRPNGKLDEMPEKSGHRPQDLGNLEKATIGLLEGISQNMDLIDRGISKKMSFLVKKKEALLLMSIVQGVPLLPIFHLSAVTEANSLHHGSNTRRYKLYEQGEIILIDQMPFSSNLLHLEDY